MTSRKQDGMNIFGETRDEVIARLQKERAELVTVLRNLIDASVNPYDEGPFEDGEMPVLDAARATLTKLGA